MKKSLLLFALSTVLCSYPIMADTPAGQKTAESGKKYEPKNYDHLLGHVEGLNDDLLKMHFKLYRVCQQYQQPPAKDSGAQRFGKKSHA